MKQMRDRTKQEMEWTRQDEMRMRQKMGERQTGNLAKKN